MLDGAKVLITGHTGKVGQVVAAHFAPRCELWGLARYTREGSREATERLGVKPVSGDFAAGALEGVPTDFDYVLHFAANTNPATQDEGMADNAEGAGLLMHHCREAKAFLHVSSAGVYWRNPDPLHRYSETDRIGGSADNLRYYGASKTAAEGVVRTLSRIHGLASTIARLDAAYGARASGSPGRSLDSLRKGEPITIPASWPRLHMPIHEDDIVAQIEPLLAAAQVGGNVLNWGGDEVVSVEAFTDYLASLIGVTATYRRTDENAGPQTAMDLTKKLRFIGPCAVHWRDGMKRMVEARLAAAA